MGSSRVMGRHEGDAWAGDLATLVREVVSGAIEGRMGVEALRSRFVARAIQEGTCSGKPIWSGKYRDQPSTDTAGCTKLVPSWEANDTTLDTVTMRRYNPTRRWSSRFGVRVDESNLR